MLACVFEKKEQWAIQEIEEPRLAPDEVLVRVKAAESAGLMFIFFAPNIF